MLVHVPKSFDRDKTIHGLTTTLLSQYTMQPEIEDQLFENNFSFNGQMKSSTSIDIGHYFKL